MKQKLSNLWGKDGTKSVLASLISILIGMVVGALIIIIVGAANPSLGLNSAWEGIRLVFGGLFSTGRDAAGTLTFGFNSTNLGNMLFRATPLILTGLSVAVAFKTGLFNIGAPGQYLMGTAATLILALTIPTETVPAPLVWLIAFLGGMLAGALWGCIPGLVKAFLNINEVLACIMTNWVAANLVTWMFDISNFKNTVENTKSGYIYKTSFNGVATPKLGLDKLFPGSQVNAGILVAILIGIPTGIISAKKQYSMMDNTAMLLSLIGVAMPNFWFGLLMVILFALTLGWLPSQGMGEGFIPLIKSLVLPAVTLGTGAAAMITRMTRSSMLEVIRQDYIDTARAKASSQVPVGPCRFLSTITSMGSGSYAGRPSGL